ncbi:MAG: hypothetical protein HUU10_04220 [Bacteroidetes bacterium]|nr:hypothetical protein [Bacteroidota bacterium]
MLATTKKTKKIPSGQFMAEQGNAHLHEAINQIIHQCKIIRMELNTGTISREMLEVVEAIANDDTLKLAQLQNVENGRRAIRAILQDLFTEFVANGLDKRVRTAIFFENLSKYVLWFQFKDNDTESMNSVTEIVDRINDKYYPIFSVFIDSFYSEASDDLLVPNGYQVLFDGIETGAH